MTEETLKTAKWPYSHGKDAKLYGPAGGFGLYIVHYYVRMMDGRMYIKNKDDGGTLVKLIFPKPR